MAPENPFGAAARTILETGTDFSGAGLHRTGGVIAFLQLTAAHPAFAAVDTVIAVSNTPLWKPLRPSRTAATSLASRNPMSMGSMIPLAASSFSRERHIASLGWIVFRKANIDGPERFGVNQFDSLGRQQIWILPLLGMDPGPERGAFSETW